MTDERRWTHTCSPTYTHTYTQGFDEYMNLVLDDAVEVNTKKGTKRPVGRIMLKGDNIALIQQAHVQEATS